MPKETKTSKQTDIEDDMLLARGIAVVEKTAVLTRSATLKADPALFPILDELVCGTHMIPAMLVDIARNGAGAKVDKVWLLSQIARMEVAMGESGAGHLHPGRWPRAEDPGPRRSLARRLLGLLSAGNTIAR